MPAARRHALPIQLRLVQWQGQQGQHVDGNKKTQGPEIKMRMAQNVGHCKAFPLHFLHLNLSFQLDNFMNFRLRLNPKN